MDKIKSIIGIKDCINYILIVIGMFVTWFSAKEDLKTKEIWIFGFLAYIFVFIAYSLLLYLSYKLKKTERESGLILERLNEISLSIKNNNIHTCNVLNTIVDTGNDNFKTIQLIENTSNENIDREADLKANMDKYINSLFNTFNIYCRNTTDEILNVQSTYLKIKNCHRKVSVAIKLLKKIYYPEIDNNESVKVYTAFRDNKTYSQGGREIGKELFSISGNSDFHQCTCQEYFFKNNIEEKNKDYINENKSFSKFYNSTVVVPIRKKRFDNKWCIFGFLCCDCQNNDKTEIFDKTSAQYLYASAQNIAIFLETLDSNWKVRFSKHNTYNDILCVLFSKLYKPNRKN